MNPQLNPHGGSGPPDPAQDTDPKRPQGQPGASPSETAKPAEPSRGQQPVIQIPPEEWMRLNSDLQALRNFKAEQEAIAERLEAERFKAMTDKGQIQEALDSLKEKNAKKVAELQTVAQESQRKWLDQNRSLAISEQLQGRSFSGTDPKATAEMLRKILETDIEAVADAAGNAMVRDKRTLRPAADFLKEALDSPAYAMFFAPASKGGSGADASRPAGSTANPAVEQDPFKAWAQEYQKKRNDAIQGAYLLN